MDTIRTEIYSQKYNLQSKDNLDSLPAKPAVYGIFAIIDGQPVHCRHTGYATDLQAAVRNHFDADLNPGLRTFMQGPWLKMLLYTLPDSAGTDEQLRVKAAEWERQFVPLCDADGEYQSELSN
jgi:hypothetical protein